MIDQIARRDRAPIFFVAFRRRFLLRGRNRFVDLLCGVFPPFAQSFGICQFKIDNFLLGHLQTILREWLALDFIGDVTGVVVFAVTGQPQNRSDDQLRRTTRARTFHRATDDVETSRAKIRSIDLVTFESVTLRAIHQIGAGKFAVVRRRVRVMIVRRDHDERHLLDRGDVHSLVRRAGLHAAFADRRQADKILFAFESFRHKRAHRHRNHRAEMTDHGELTFERFAAMNVAVASAHRTLPRAEISARNIDQRLAEGRASGLIANERRKDVALLCKNIPQATLTASWPRPT